jgi:WD40 repeat protein
MKHAIETTGESTADPNATRPGMDATIPPLRPLSADDAGEIRLLRAFAIPGFGRSSLSQASVSFSPDGRLLSGVCYLSTIPIWRLPDGSLARSLESSPVQEVAVAFHPDGGMIATGGFGGEIRVWETETGRLRATLGPLPSPIWELAFSPDGQSLASANFDYGRASALGKPSMRLWNVADGTMVWEYSGDERQPRALSVSYAPDGKTIAFGTFEGALVLDADTGTLLASLPVPDHVGDLAFSPDGAWLATASDDARIRLWDTVRYQVRTTLEGHGHFVNGVAFTPDGAMLVSGSHDRSVGIWDAHTGGLLAKLSGHASEVLRVAVNPAGTLIASISWDGTVCLWGIPR